MPDAELLKRIENLEARQGLRLRWEKGPQAPRVGPRELVLHENDGAGGNFDVRLYARRGNSVFYFTGTPDVESSPSPQFLRADTSDNYTSGTLTFNAGTTLDIDGNLDISGATLIGTTPFLRHDGSVELSADWLAGTAKDITMGGGIFYGQGAVWPANYVLDLRGSTTHNVALGTHAGQDTNLYFYNKGDGTGNMVVAFFNGPGSSMALTAGASDVTWEGSSGAGFKIIASSADLTFQTLLSGDINFDVFDGNINLTSSSGDVNIGAPSGFVTITDSTSSFMESKAAAVEFARRLTLLAGFDAPEEGVPAAPAANTLRLFNSSVSGELSVIDSGSIVTSLMGGGVDPVPFATEVDDVGAGVTYIGEAAAGTATSAALWRIKKMTETGPDISIIWADGDTNQDNIWDNRASLSYS